MVVEVAKLLEQRSTVPAVMARIGVIRKVQQPQFWQSGTLDVLEDVRLQLRDLIKLLADARRSRKFVIDIDDNYSAAAEPIAPYIHTSYKERVLDYLNNNTNSPTLRKIKNLEQLTADDFIELERIFFEELGTRDEYVADIENFRYKSNIAAFIRKINGFDFGAAMEIYQQLVDDSNLTSEQELYLKEILDYVKENGDIEARCITGELPFKAYDWQMVFGNQFVRLREFVEHIHNVVQITA